MKRTYHPDCEIEIAASDLGEAFFCDDAEVWIEGDAILVSYFDEDGIVVLEGQGDPATGWELVARSRPRKATLVLSAAKSGKNEESGQAGQHGEGKAAFSGSIQESGESTAWTMRLAPADSSIGN